MKYFEMINFLILLLFSACSMKSQLAKNNEISQKISSICIIADIKTNSSRIFKKELEGLLYNNNNEIPNIENCKYVLIYNISSISSIMADSFGAQLQQSKRIDINSALFEINPTKKFSLYEIIEHPEMAKFDRYTGNRFRGIARSTLNLDDKDAEVALANSNVYINQVEKLKQNHNLIKQSILSGINTYVKNPNSLMSEYQGNIDAEEFTVKSITKDLYNQIYHNLNETELIKQKIKNKNVINEQENNSIFPVKTPSSN